MPVITSKKNAKKIIDPYANFDIRISLPDGTGNYSITASSTYGETPTFAQQRLPSDFDFTDLVAYLQDLVARPEDAEVLGEQLRQFLFPLQVHQLFVQSQAQVQAQGKKGLRIRLHIRSEQMILNDIPWEYCRDEQSFLALNKATPLVRYIPTSSPPKTMIVPETVRILVGLSNPENYPVLNVRLEETHIRQALANLIDEERVDLYVLNPTTPSALRQAIEKFDPHIFHFVGYGEVKENGEGSLILVNDKNQSHLADSQDIMILLRNSNVKLVVLSACHTAKQGDRAPSSLPIRGVASKLVEAGISAVIGMQFAIPDNTIVAFMGTLYERLAIGDPLDLALTQARISSYFDQQDKVFWAIPVLFMRAPSGLIWYSRNQSLSISEAHEVIIPSTRIDQLIPSQPSVPDYSFTIAQGLIALTKLMQSPKIKAHMEAFRTNFEAACEQIDILGAYKQLHDHLHDGMCQ